MSQPEGQVGVGPPHRPDFLKPTYANFVNVSHTPWDFRLTFSLLGTEASEQDEHGNVLLTPEVVSEVIIPANLMAAFATAVQENFSRYMNAFGPPGMNPEGPFADSQGDG